ncbi:YjcZ family sporulation protein [Siminovitchia sp. 179-K 8D1 HS]
MHKMFALIVVLSMLLVIIEL